MRNLKNLVAIVLSLVLVFSMATVAFATNLDYTNEIEVSAVVTPAEAKAGDTVTVSFFFKDTAAKDGFIELTSGGSIGFDFSYDTTIVTKTGANAGYSLPSKDFSDKTADTMYILVRPEETLNVTETEAVATCTFTVNDGVAAGKYDIIKSIVAPYIGDLEGYEPDSYITAIDKLTVKGADPDPDPEYTVTFKDGEDTVVTETATKDNGYKVTAPADPTKVGYTFKYWSLTADGAAYDFATPVTADITLYAVFEKNPAPVFTGSMDRTNITVDGKEYTNVLVGKYSITPDGKKWIGCEFYPDTEGWTGTKGALGFKEGFEFEGGATVEFSTAIVGVPAGTGIVIAPVYAD